MYARGDRVGRLARTVALTSLPGVAAVALALLVLPGVPWSMNWIGRLLLALAVTAAAERPVTTLRIGHSGETWTFGAAALVVDLCLVPAAWVVVLACAAALGTALSEGRGAQKSAFQASSVAVSAGIAGGVAGLGGATGHGLTSVAFAVALAAGVLLAAVWSSLAVGAVVAAAQDMPLRDVVLPAARVDAQVYGLNVLLGLGVVTVARHSPVTLVAVPVVAALLGLVHRATLREQEETDVWRQLEDAGRELKTLSEADIVPRAVARTAALLRCDRVELVLRQHDAPTQVVIHRGGLRGLAESTIEPGPLVVPRGDGRPVPSRSAGGDTQVEVALPGPGGGIGLLRVTMGGNVSVRERELQVLATYARTVASTLLNARLYADAVAEAELKAWQAGHDTLTGLVNRTGLMELAGALEESAGRTGELFALLVLDMDHFKQVNDTLGHDSGDRLIQHLGSVLVDRVRRGDVAARLEGDTFALLVRHLPDEAAVEGIANDIQRCISEPVDHEDLRLSLEGTVGYAVGPADGTTLALVLKRAEMTTTDAKASPGSSRRWRADRDEQSRERLALSADLRSGLADELLLHYQPQVDLVTGAVRGVEALARWQHPTRGLLMPADFVPVAERSGLARPFTLAVLDAAVREAALWKALGLGDGEVSVAVNLSARNLLDRELPGDVAVVLARHGLPARQLILEITETVAMSELEVVNDVLARLRTLGVQLSVDDFGTGYSSLKFLQAIAVNELKIDREFVSRMLERESDAALVRATVELGHSLGLRVVAEGVESAGHLEALVALGCDAAQGHHVARPVPAEVLRELLLPSSGKVVPLRAARRRFGSA